MRIKKQGIDYFPIETGILGDARIRIVMKNGGDAAFTVIIALLAQIYGTNGYYIAADEDLYKNIEVLLFELSRQKIKKIIAMAIDEGIFSKEMFTTHSIITSAQIQEQFFFSTQRRNSHKVMPQYLLIEESSLPRKSRNDMPTPKNTDDTEAEKRLFDEETECNNNTIADKNPENACNGTHSKEEQSINNTPLTPLKGSSDEMKTTVSPPRANKKELTMADIAALQPPQDNTPRNYHGLLHELMHHRIPATEQYAIIKRSNYGAIGNMVWKGLATLMGNPGKIKMPGRYLMSLFKQ